LNGSASRRLLRQTITSAVRGAADGLMLATSAQSPIMPGRCPIQRLISRNESMKHKPTILIYAILADDKPVAAIETSGNEARELLKEQWFLQELSTLKVDGEPIYKPGTRLRARPATEDEWAIYDQECKTAEDADEILFVYLVDLDP
jgi:hypothetical protein